MAGAMAIPSTVPPQVPPRVPLTFLVASAAVLAAVFVFQYGLGLAPCELCVLQRWPHLAVIALAAAAAAWPSGRRGLLGLVALAYAVTAGIGAFHVGVEHHWWAGTSACGVTSTADGLEALKAQLLAAPVVRCDDVAWSLFGISMAGYNFLLSLVLGTAAAVAALTRRFG